MGLRSSDAGVGSDFVVGLFFAVTVGLPFAYAGMVVVGVPTYLLLQRLGYVKAWVMCLVGAGVPLVLIAGEANSLMLATVGLSGFVVSLVAFMLATRSRQQHEV
jgi:EamA domain-containing membrane protein RarD